MITIDLNDCQHVTILDSDGAPMAFETIHSQADPKAFERFICQIIPPWISVSPSLTEAIKAAEDIRAVSPRRRSLE